MKRIWLLFFIFTFVGCVSSKPKKPLSDSLSVRNEKLFFKGQFFTGTKETLLKIISDGKTCECKQPPAHESITVLEIVSRLGKDTASGYAFFVQNKTGHYWKKIDFLPYREWQGIISLKRNNNEIEAVLRKENETPKKISYVLTDKGVWQKV